MNRQLAAPLHISSLHVQQGLFALLALLVTLVVGQAFMRWTQPTVEHQRVFFQAPVQTHFSAIGSASASGDRVAYSLTPVEQADSLGDLPRQDRWVF
ncbi:hypothetical protein NLK61_12830 [Pseudomonas fuscovaginae UPB0736]|uniref:Uncharacterized protein n=1 Tax=Pseudomonas asplenii TaxID=53407 RepID=A0A1H6LPY7_9PSED|nr:MULTISPECIES: hypothetical protein [Pseudomonas]UUQ67467.1 hypothetical protein NLK61_12830 [Pseudomonas fuscovaginae UPB0736]UZE29264.1 hypothetical protein LOY63_00445 [Pseudomonas asplenii]SDS37100.1 hypothetical protein SAMN05216598_1377 [Pseudomonas asplenii]SEH90724.1 hypothetical protein SAMN05216581_0444 [Pseudomonas fuscovaginae]